MSALGILKTKEIKLQGTHGVDFKLKVDQDKFNIQRGDVKLVTISQDDTTSITDSTIASGTDQINISAPIEFENSVNVKGKFVLDFKFSDSLQAKVTEKMSEITPSPGSAFTNVVIPDDAKSPNDLGVESETANTSRTQDQTNKHIITHIPQSVFVGEKDGSQVSAFRGNTTIDAGKVATPLTGDTNFMTHSGSKLLTNFIAMKVLCELGGYEPTTFVKDITGFEGLGDIDFYVLKEPSLDKPATHIACMKPKITTNPFTTLQSISNETEIVSLDSFNKTNYLNTVDNISNDISTLKASMKGLVDLSKAFSSGSMTEAQVIGTLGKPDITTISQFQTLVPGAYAQLDSILGMEKRMTEAAETGDKGVIFTECIEERQNGNKQLRICDILSQSNGFGTQGNLPGSMDSLETSDPIKRFMLAIRHHSDSKGMSDNILQSLQHLETPSLLKKSLEQILQGVQAGLQNGYTAAGLGSSDLKGFIDAEGTLDGALPVGTVLGNISPLLEQNLDMDELTASSTASTIVNMLSTALSIEQVAGTIGNVIATNLKVNMSSYEYISGKIATTSSKTNRVYQQYEHGTRNYSGTWHWIQALVEKVYNNLVTEGKLTPTGSGPDQVDSTGASYYTLYHIMDEQLFVPLGMNSSYLHLKAPTTDGSGNTVYDPLLEDDTTTFTDGTYYDSNGVFHDNADIVATFLQNYGDNGIVDSYYTGTKTGQPVNMGYKTLSAKVNRSTMKLFYLDAGNARSTINDMLKFFRMVCDGGLAADGSRVIDSVYLNFATNVQTDISTVDGSSQNAQNEFLNWGINSTMSGGYSNYNASSRIAMYNLHTRQNLHYTQNQWQTWGGLLRWTFGISQKDNALYVEAAFLRDNLTRTSLNPGSSSFQGSFFAENRFWHEKGMSQIWPKFLNEVETPPRLR